MKWFLNEFPFSGIPFQGLDPHITIIPFESHFNLPLLDIRKFKLKKEIRNSLNVYSFIKGVPTVSL